MRRLAALALALVPTASVLAQEDGFEAPTPKTPAEYVQSVRDELTRHKYFSSVLLVESKAAEPVVLLLHQPQVPKEGWEAVTAGRVAPWLKKTDAKFRELFATPLGLSRRAETPVSIVCVLQTHGDYVNYEQKVEPLSTYGDAANFERRYHISTGFDSGKFTGAYRTSAIVGEFSRALVDEHYAGSASAPLASWIEWGIAGYFGMSCGKAPESLDAPQMNVSLIQYLLGNLDDDSERFVYIYPLAELSAVTSLPDAANRADARAKSAGLDSDSGYARAVFQIQAASWFSFLLDADSGKRRDGFRKYLALAMAGRASKAELFSALGVADDLSLDRAHMRWMIERYDASKPKVPLGVATAERLFRLPAKGAAPAASASKPGASSKPAAFDPRSIGIAAEDLEAEHGIVLQLVRSGDVEAARPRLAALLERARGGPIERRVERDVQRVDAFAKLRETFLAHLVASPEKHAFEVDGKKVNAKAVKVEGGFVVLGENRQKLEKLPVTTFTPFVVARDLPGKLAGGADGWVKPWGFVLESDERWKKLLAGDDASVRQLRNDAEDWIGKVVALGSVAKALDELATAGVPDDEFDAALCVDRIERLMKSSRDSELVAARLSSLAKLAELALAFSYDPADLERALGCRIERLGGERVRVVHDFDSWEQLRGAATPSATVARYHKQMPDLLAATAAACEVDRGVLRMVGATQWQTALRFRAPLDVRMVSRHREGAGEYQSSCFVFAGVDDAGGFAASTTIGCLLAVANSRAKSVEDWACGDLYLDTNLTTVLSVKDGRASSSLDGRPVASVPFAPTTAGAVAVLVHADAPVEIDELVVEGELDGESAKSAWIGARRAELGFAP